MIKYRVIIRWEDGTNDQSLHNSEDGARQMIKDLATLASPATVEWNEGITHNEFFMVARLRQHDTTLALFGLQRIEVGDGDDPGRALRGR